MSTAAHSSGIRAIVVVRDAETKSQLVRVDDVNVDVCMCDRWIYLKSKTDRLGVFPLSNEVLYNVSKHDKLTLMYAMETTYDLRTKLALVQAKVVPSSGQKRSVVGVLRARNIDVESGATVPPTTTVFVPCAIALYGRFAADSVCDCGSRRLLLQLRNGKMESKPVLCARLCNLDSPYFTLGNYTVEPDRSVSHMSLQDTVAALKVVDSSKTEYVDVFGTLCLTCRHCIKCKRMRRRKNNTRATCKKHTLCASDALKKVCECEYNPKKNLHTKLFRLRSIHEKYF